jgi:hypothetical protein
MGHAILRIEKRKSASSVASMSAHALRETTVPNAIEGAPKPEVIHGAKTTAELMQTLRQTIAIAKAKGGRQGFTKASTPVIDILITTSHGDMQKMSLKQQNEYFLKGLDFVAAKFGGIENVLTAAIHRDETTVHMQLLVMPYDRTINRFVASKMIGGPVGLSRLQDGFYEVCGAPYGLSRGEKGSNATHVPPRKLYTAMAKGAEPPQFVQVPAELGMSERLKPGYREKKIENDRLRAEAMAHNKAERARLNEQAKRGRMMHPKLIEREAERYRKNVRLEELLKTEKELIAVERAEAAKDKADAIATLQRVQHATEELKLQARAADGMWTKSGAQMLDKWSRHMAPEMVARASKALGIKLVPGKPLIDQMRKQGVGNTLQDCADRLDRALDGIMAQHVSSGDAQRAIEREKGG